jgi:hypothetical protein
MSFIVFLTVLLIAIVVWFSFKLGSYIDSGPPGTWRAAISSRLRKHRKLFPFVSLAILMHVFWDDIGPFFYKLVWAKAYRADFAELQSAAEIRRPQAVAAIYQGTRACIKRNARAELPGFVDELLSEYTLLTFDGWFADENMDRVWKTRLLPRYHEYDPQIAALTRQQRKALDRLMDGTSDGYNTHYSCVARNAIRWLDARKPDNRGKA